SQGRRATPWPRLDRVGNRGRHYGPDCDATGAGLNENTMTRPSPEPRMSLNKLTVGVGEDDDGHALLIRKNLERVGFGGEIVRLRNGREVLDYFPEAAARGDRRDRLLLLDINMPQLNGIEVLQHMKQNPPTASVPVIMLTTTDNPR